MLGRRRPADFPQRRAAEAARHTQKSWLGRSAGEVGSCGGAGQRLCRSRRWRACEDVAEVSDVALDVPRRPVGAVRRIEVNACGHAPVGGVAELVHVHAVEAWTGGHGTSLAPLARRDGGRCCVNTRRCAVNWSCRDSAIESSSARSLASAQRCGGDCTWLQGSNDARDAKVPREDDERAKLLEGHPPHRSAGQDAHRLAQRPPRALPIEQSHKAASSRNDRDDRRSYRPHVATARPAPAASEMLVWLRSLEAMEKQSESVHCKQWNNHTSSLRSLSVPFLPRLACEICGLASGSTGGVLAARRAGGEQVGTPGARASDFRHKRKRCETHKSNK